MALAAMCLAFVVGCNEEDTVLTSQQEQIVRYLTSSHNPRLIAEQEVPNSMVANPPFYERINTSVYRYIATYYDAGRSSKRKVKVGDEVELIFEAYEFTGNAPSLNALYYTNNADLIAKLEENGLNTEFWTAEPLKVKIGSGDIIKGIETSLIDCREGDVVEVYLAYDMAYDKHVVGVVPSKSSVVWAYQIKSVSDN
jgi:hypothetical protein